MPHLMNSARPSGDVVVFRPRRLRVVAALWAAGLCMLSAFGWLALPEEVRALFTWSQKLTLLGCLGVILFVLGAMAGSYVRADSRGLRFRNGVRTHDVGWDRVHKFLLRPGDPWGLVLLKPDDGTEFRADVDAEKRALMGIQAHDRQQARDAIAELQRRQQLAPRS